MKKQKSKRRQREFTPSRREQFGNGISTYSPYVCNILQCVDVFEIYANDIRPRQIMILMNILLSYISNTSHMYTDDFPSTGARL